MKPAREYSEDLARLEPHPEVERVEGRGGAATLRVKGLFLHSRYNPEQEAARLIDSAALDTARPVLVVGLGLGYPIAELQKRGFEVAVAEPDARVAALALAQGLFEPSCLLGIGDPDEWVDSEAFRALARRMPQALLHPPTAQLYPEYASQVLSKLTKAAFAGVRFNICVVGPIYGGSEPMGGYLTNAFRELGHNARLISNADAWPMYQLMTQSIENKQASEQIGNVFAKLLGQWTYLRVAEFNPEICIVLAQAPVDRVFPARLAEREIISAFWYVENWRHLPYWKEVAPYYDYFFHIQPGEFERKLDEAGCQHHAYVQTGCAPAQHRPVTLSPEEQQEFGCDLSFAGAGYFNRNQFFKGLTDYAFKLWGIGFHDRQLYPLLVGGEKNFDSETFMKVVAGSKINLNLHSSTSHDGVDPKCDAINPRVYEIAAAGGFQICDPAVGLDTQFDFDTELPVYRDLQSCRKLIDHYLAHPEERAAVAQRARARALKEHTYAHRAQQMLDCILERHGPRILRRGVRVQRSIREMRERLDAKSELARWLESLPQDTLFEREAIRALLPPRSGGMKYPEQLFCFMNEVTDFADTLFKEMQ